MLNNVVGLFGTGGGVANSYESIATVSVGGGGQASAEFTSIASTWKHLQVRFAALPSSTASTYRIRCQFNTDTGNNYATHLLLGNGTAASAAAASTTNQITVGSSILGTGTIILSGVLDVLDYANTNKYKTTRALSGGDFNGAGEVAFTSGLWMNTAAVTSIKLYFDTANLAQYSSFALYGIKG